MTLATTLLGLTIAVPTLLLLACLSASLRNRMSGWLPFAPLPGLGAALMASGTALDLPPLLLRLRLALDEPSAVLLGVAALLWIAAGTDAAIRLRDDPRRGRFAVWWLLTLTGSLGVFIAADLVSFYLLFSMVSLAAYGLVIEGSAPDAPRVGMIYVAMAIFGEALLLIGFVMLAEAAQSGGFLIRDAVAALPDAMRRDTIMALIILGFGVKLGMVPFQFWMPITYRTAPIPAAAVLSGAAVKAGVIGLIRFLPLGVAMPGWGHIMVVLGFVSAFYGAMIGLRQANPRTVLAFSSISQMGVIIAVFGMGIASGEPTVAMSAAFYGAHHTLVKGGLFLGVGLAPRVGAHHRWLVLAPAAVMAVGMAGLPLSGGFLAKLAIKPLLGEGVAAILGSVSSIATAALMTHFLFRLVALPRSDRPMASEALLRWPWLAIAAGSVVVPWVLYATVLNASLAYALSGASVLQAGWPVAVGAAMGWAWRSWGGAALTHRDETVIMPVAARLEYKAIGVATMIERVEAGLRTWTVAMASLLTLVIALVALMWASH
ncbi:MAG: complex I subunit 5 family protein [Acetobacteraceae bacterium]